MSTVNTSPKQGTAGPRLAQMTAYVKTLLQKDFYVNKAKDSVLTVISIVSIIALYSVIGTVWLRNVILSLKLRLRGRGATKSVTRKSPPKTPEPIAKPVEDIGLNMDEVQEIPGEGELAAMKEGKSPPMPARDQIPEIDDEPQVGSSDERETTHIMSDDDTTVIDQDEAVGVKGIPGEVPVIKHDFERPISPPLTPPAEASDLRAPVADVEALQPELASGIPAVVNAVPDESFVPREPSARNSTIEEAAKAVEEHAKIVEDATSPTESTLESSKPESGSPLSEFVVVSDVEKRIENVPAPVEDSNKAIEEAENKPSAVVEPTTIEAPVPAVAPEQTMVAEPKLDVAAPVVEDTNPAQEAKQVEESKAAAEEPKVTEKPQVIEVPKLVEEPKVAEEPVVEEPQIEEPESVEVPSAEGSPKAAFPSLPKPAREDPVTPASPKSLIGRPRVMRRATGSTPAVAGITTSPAPATVASPVTEERTSIRAQMNNRANDALNRLADSLLRSPTRATSPPPSGIPRAVSPPPRATSPITVPRSASPADRGRSETPSGDAGSRSSSPAFTTARRGSVTAPRPPSRQSTLANVTNAPERSSPPARRATFTNPPRSGAASPPPLPLPPQRQGLQGIISPQPQQQGNVRASPNPQVPQPAVMSPSVSSRKATIDSSGSPGSPPNGRRAASPPPARSPVEELTTDQTARRNLPFPSPVEGPSIAGIAALKQRSRPRTSTNGSANAPTAPNTLLATLTSKITLPGSSNSSSTSASGPISPNPTSPASPASPNRSDSLASAVSNRSSIYSFSDMSDMDMSTSDLDFAGRESHRMVLNGARFDSMSSIGSDDGAMSGNEEEKREKRAKRRAKARAQALKKQKRSKRN